MSKFKIPNDERRFSQVNDGEIGGNVWLSQNLDFKSNKGKLRVSPRLVINQSSSDDADLGRVVAFAKFPGVPASAGTLAYWAICGAVLFKTAGNPTTPDYDFSQDNIASSPTDLEYQSSDMVVAPNGLLVSTHDDVYLLSNAGAWSSYWKTTLSQTFTSTTGSHMMEVLFNLSIAISDGNTICTIVSPYTDTYETKAIVTLRPEDKILWIKTASTRVWTGTINTKGGEGLVYEWDGASANTTRAYKIGATGALAGLIKDDIPYIMTSDGSLKVFNGAGFKTIAQLPHTSSDLMLKLSASGSLLLNDKWIHPNGMKLIDGNINILINNLLDEDTDYTSLIENEPSGIWEYDEEIGLYHKYSFTLDTAGSLDYGQNAIGYAGALFETKQKEAAHLAGAGVYTDNGSTLKTAIFYDELPNTLAKAGVLVTPWLQSSEITDVWQKLWLKFKDLDNSADEIIVKYRTKRDKNLPAIYSSTYTSTTTFTITSTTNLLATTNILKVGGEVEIIMASGSGKSAHISSVSMTESGGTWTYTVTLDEAICPSSGTGKVRFNNWVKLGTINTQNITNTVFPFGNVLTEIEMQIKLELRGTGNNPEINQLIILSAPQLPIK